MKKSTLLSLITAGAIVTTTAGTFAAWDQMSVTSNKTAVTIEKAVTMTIQDAQFTTTTKTDLTNAAPEQSTTINIDVKDVPESAKDKYILKTTAKIFESDGTTVAKSEEVTVTATPTESALKGTATDSHEVTVQVTPKTTSAAGKTYQVEVTAELVAKPAA